MKDRNTLWIMLGVFLLTIFLGGVYLNFSHWGYVESAILYLAGVVAAGAVWIGRKK